MRSDCTIDTSSGHPTEKTMKIWPVLICVLLSGCAASFGDFYSARIPVHALEAYSGKTEIYETSDVATNAQTLHSHGYVIIGESEFQSANVLHGILEAQLRGQAKKVGADVVLWERRDAGVAIIKTPILVRVPGESQLIMTSSSANANVQVGGVSGHGSASGFSTTLVQTPATYRTETMEIAQQRITQRAIFFRKAK